MSRIKDDLPDSVVSALAQALGFSPAFDRTPGADEWTLSAGHGASHVSHVGSKRTVCAFLIGYSTMRIEANQILNDLEHAGRSAMLEMRTRLEWGNL